MIGDNNSADDGNYNNHTKSSDKMQETQRK